MFISTYLIFILLIVVGITFLRFKRPIYECMFYGYVSMICFTGEFSNFFTYIGKTAQDTLFYSIISFLVFAKILDLVNAVDDIVALIIYAFGRFRGGAAYTAVLGSTFMGALSGSGAGNVATTGVFTIPSMIRSGFPPHVAANIESASSTMGNMIPPSGAILVSLSCYNKFKGEDFPQSDFWIVMWGICAWFILQRLLTVYFFSIKYNVEPLKASDMHNTKDRIKDGWKNILLPLIILLPFMLDYVFKDTLFVNRLGIGAKSLSSCLLLFAPGVATAYVLLVNRSKLKGKSLIGAISDSVASIVPVGSTIFFAYCISGLFTSAKIGQSLCEYIQECEISLVGLAFFIPLVTAILGMILPGTAQIKIFGVAIITIIEAAGGDALIAAAMLPVITGAMEGMTPPLALCMYTAMGIAGSNIRDTTRNCFVWLILHYVLSVVCLLGMLPILGI